MNSQLIAPLFLFRFAIPCQYTNQVWSENGIMLDESYSIPAFAELEGKPRFADLRMGWNPKGIAITLQVRNKKQPTWCRVSRIEDSDSLSLWIASRDVSSLHRANRYCHQYLFMPRGGGVDQSEAIVERVEIGRAKEDAAGAKSNTVRVRGEKRIDGYLLQAFIPSAAIHGYRPAEHSQLGFNYLVIDRDFGRQTLSLGNEYPVESEPSLWGTLELLPDVARRSQS